jgi:hypothetical protein
MLQVFGGDFLDRWVSRQVMGFLDIDATVTQSLRSKGPLADHSAVSKYPLQMSPRRSRTAKRSQSTTVTGVSNVFFAELSDLDSPLNESLRYDSNQEDGQRYLSPLGHDVAADSVTLHDVFRAVGVLPALPWLRGLAKAIQGVHVEHVIKTVTFR